MRVHEEVLREIDEGGVISSSSEHSSMTPKEKEAKTKERVERHLSDLCKAVRVAGGWGDRAGENGGERGVRELYDRLKKRFGGSLNVPAPLQWSQARKEQGDDGVGAYVPPKEWLLVQRKEDDMKGELDVVKGRKGSTLKKHRPSRGMVRSASEQRWLFRGYGCNGNGSMGPKSPPVMQPQPQQKPVVPPLEARIVY